MMDSTERDREFVARLAAQGPRLHEAKMMRVGRFATAQQAGLLSNKTKVRLVTITAGGRNRERTLVEAVGLMTMISCQDDDRVFYGCSRRRGVGARSRWQLPEPLLENFLHQLGVSRGEAVFVGERSARPRRELVSRG